MSDTHLAPPAVTGNLAADIATDASNVKVATTATATATAAASPTPFTLPTGTISEQLQQLQAKFNATLLADLNSALTLANTKDASGNVADATAAPAYQALINLVTLVNSFQPTPGQVAPVTELEQLRIIARTIQSQAFKDAVAPLLQDLQSQATSILSSILGIVGGAAKIGIALP
jgi:hypothetical protein